MAGGPAPFLLLLLAAGSCTASSAGARHAPALPRVTWWRKSSISLVAGDDAAPVLAVEGLAVWPGFSGARRHGDGDGDGGYESTPLLSGVAFKVCAGERVAVVGPNGCGKTSLLRVLAGLRAPATGQVVTRPGVSVGYLPQEFLELVRGDGRTAEEMVAGALAAAEGAGRATGTPAFAEAEVEAEAVSGLAAAAEALETEAKAKAAAAEAETQVSADARRLAVARTQLHELGFGDDLCERAARDLSHGWATRLGLACALVPQPALVLLDEPTNHVDLLALEWLERFLCGPRLRGCACVLVSHDREFVDRVATAVLAVEAGRTRLFRGGYRQYVALRRLQEEAQKERRARGVSTQALRQAVDASATGRKGRGVAAGEGRARGGHGGGDDDDDDEVLWDGEGAQASTKRKAKPWEAMRGVGDAGGARRGRPSAMRFRIPPAPACPDHLGGLQGCTFRYDGAQTPVVRNATMALFRGDRVGIIGANGAGKSTLLRLLLGDLMPTTGSAGLAGVKAVAASETGVPGQAARKVRADQVLETLAEAEANAKTTTKIEAQARVRPFFFAQNLADRIDGRLTLVEALLAGPDSILTATQGQGRGEGDNFVPWERAPMAVDGRCRRASTADDCEGGGEDADDAVGNSAAEARAHRLLTKMRFARGTHDRLVSSLSCGERARLVLCMMLQSSANVLVLDEPTNHLDIETVERLEEALRYFDGSLVVASHDRFFVAETTRTVVVMGTGDEGELQVFQGGWAEYSAAADVAWRGAAAVGARRAADTHFVAARQHAPKMVTVDGHFFDGTGRRLARARRRDERRPIKRQGTLKRMKRARRRNIGQPKKDSKGEAGTMRP